MRQSHGRVEQFGSSGWAEGRGGEGPEPPSLCSCGFLQERGLCMELSGTQSPGQRAEVYP